MVERIVFGNLVPPVGHHRNSLYIGSGKRQHCCSSQENSDTLGPSKYRYYVLHLSKEFFLKNVSNLEVAKIYRFYLLYAYFNVWKKVGNYCCMLDNRVLLLLPKFFQTLKLGNIREKQSVLITSILLTFLENGSSERWRIWYLYFETPKTWGFSSEEHQYHLFTEPRFRALQSHTLGTADQNCKGD